MEDRRFLPVCFLGLNLVLSIGF